MDRNACPYCSFTSPKLHVLFDHLERQHVLELVTTAADEPALAT